MKNSNATLRKMLVLALVLGCLSVTWGQEEVINLPSGRKVVIRTPNYPEHTHAFVNKEWVLTGPPGKTIQLSCTSFATYKITDDCAEYGLHIESGGKRKSYCGTLSSFKVESQGNHMNVRLEIGKMGRGKVDCVATSDVARQEERTTPKPIIKEGPVTRIHLKLNDNAFLLRNPEYPDLTLEKSLKWIITTDPGYKVGVSCQQVMFSGGENCSKYGHGLKMEYGGGEKIFCSPGGVISVGEPKVTVTVLLNTFWPGSGATISCRVNSLKTDKALERYLAVESEEEDSSEHGVVPGKKGTTCKCGWANKQSQRIIDGVTAVPNEFPFLASMLLNGWHICGASILTNTFVLSATHCTVKWNVRDLQIGLGTHVLYSETKWTQTIQVAEKIQHPGFHKGAAFNDDIVLLRLEKRIQFNDMVGPICMPKNLPNMNNKKVTTMGWGFIDEEKGLINDELQKATAHIVDPVTCKDTFAAWSLDTKHPLKVCYYGTNTSGVCSGDSGSPIVWLDPETNRYTQVTFVSYTVDGCISRTPTVGINVINYLDWIKQHVRGELCMTED